MTEEENGYYISRPMRAVMAFARFISYPIVDFFFKVMNRSRAIGLENFSDIKDGIVFASNHVSWIDTLLIPIYAAKRFSLQPFCAPGKEELFKIPVFSQIIQIWGSFPVKRRARDYEAMKRIAYYVQNYRVMLFPEGTRTKTGKLGKGRSGAGWIISSGKPVVIPTVVINTHKYFSPSKKRPWFGIPYTVVFGEPLDLTRFYSMPDNKGTSQALVNEVMKEIAALQEKHKDLYID